MAASAHSAREPCGLPHTIAPRALKNNSGIGQRKQTDANAEQALGQNQHVHGRIHPQKPAHKKAQPAQGNARRADLARFKPAAQPRGNRGGHDLHYRLERKKKPGLLHGHTASELEIQAEKKHDAKK